MRFHSGKGPEQGSKDVLSDPNLARVQLERDLASMSYAEQLEAIQPPMPLLFNDVQMSESMPRPDTVELSKPVREPAHESLDKHYGRGSSDSSVQNQVQTSSSDSGTASAGTSTDAPVQMLKWKTWLDATEVDGLAKELILGIEIETSVGEMLDAFATAAKHLVALAAAGGPGLIKLIGKAPEAIKDVVLAVLKGIAIIIKGWSEWSQPAIVAATYLFGQAVDLIETIVRELAAYGMDKALEAITGVSGLFTGFGSDEKPHTLVKKLEGPMNFLVTDFSSMWERFVTTLKWACVKYSQELSGDEDMFGEELEELDQQLDAPQEHKIADIHLGLATLHPKELGIQKSTDEQLGGIGFDFDASFNLFGEPRKVEGFKGVLDWERNFHAEMAEQKIIGDVTWQGIAIRDLSLVSFSADDNRLVASFSLASLDLGNGFVKVTDATASYDSDAGFDLETDASLDLKSPLGKWASHVSLKLEADGTFRSMDFTSFSGFDGRLSGEAAQLVPGKGIVLAGVNLLVGDSDGFSMNIVLDSLTVGFNGLIEKGMKVARRLGAKALKIVQGLTVTGGGRPEFEYRGPGNYVISLKKARFGLEHEGGLALGMDGGDFTYETENKAFSANISKLFLKYGSVSSELALDTTLDKKGFTVKRAEFSIGTVDGLPLLKLLSGADLFQGWASEHLDALSEHIKADRLGFIVNDLNWSPDHVITWGDIEIDLRALAALAGKLGTGLLKVGKVIFNLASTVLEPVLKPVVRVAKQVLKLFGGKVYAHIDQESGEGTLAGELEFPSGDRMIGAEALLNIGIPGFPIALALSTKLMGKLESAVGGKVKRVDAQKGIYDFDAMVVLTDDLQVDVGGGIKLGDEHLLQLNSYLIGHGHHLGKTQIAVGYRHRFKTDDSDPEQLVSAEQSAKQFGGEFNIAGDLSAALTIKADIKTLLNKTKSLFDIRSKDWHIGAFTLAGSFCQDASGAQHWSLTSPAVGSNVDNIDLKTMFQKPPSFKEEWIEPARTSELIEKMAANGQVFENKDRKTVKRLVYDLYNDQSVSEKRRQVLLAQLTEIAPSVTKLTRYKVGAKKTASPIVHGTFVSKMFSLKAWEEYSDVKKKGLTGLVKRVVGSRGGKIRKVDKALKKYLAALTQLPEEDDADYTEAKTQYEACQTALVALRKACTVYLRGRGRRVDAVKGLKQKIILETVQLNAKLENMEAMHELSSSGTEG